jgi:hypothetical protein
MKARTLKELFILMKKLLLRLSLAIITAIAMNSCVPLWDIAAATNDVIIDYYTPGYYYYDGFYHSRPYWGNQYHHNGNFSHYHKRHR